MVAAAGRENHPEVVTSFEMCQPSHEVLVLHARLEGTTKTVKPFMETKLPEKKMLRNEAWFLSSFSSINTYVDWFNTTNKLSLVVI